MRTIALLGFFVVSAAVAASADKSLDPIFKAVLDARMASVTPPDASSDPNKVDHLFEKIDELSRIGKPADKLLVDLLDYYLGEGPGEDVATAIISRGNRMVPSLTEKKRQPLGCLTAYSAICRDDENNRNDVVDSLIDRINNTSASPDPSALLQRIRAVGPEAVYKNDLTGEAWIAALKHMETGKKSWLEVAVAIHPATDGGPAEELTLAAGVALARVPRDVLLLAAPQLGIEGVCGYPDMGDERTNTKEKVIAYLDVRIRAVKGVVTAELRSRREKCLQVLEEIKREVSSPNGPFSEESG